MKTKLKTITGLKLYDEYYHLTMPNSIYKELKDFYVTDENVFEYIQVTFEIFFTGLHENENEPISSLFDTINFERFIESLMIPIYRHQQERT